MLPARSTLRAVAGMGGLFFLLAGTSARALDPHTALAHYGYQSWQTDTGLPQNTVHAIVQGREGFLWVATEGGLVRFDGVEFRAYTRANTPGLPSDLVDDLMEDHAGTLWISTSGGLARMRSGKVEELGAAQGVPATQVWRTFEDARGRVWALTAAGLFRINEDHGGELGTRAELDAALTENSRMAEGPDGGLWLGTADGLRRQSTRGGFDRLGGGGEVLALVVDRKGTAWAGMRSGLEECQAAGCGSVGLPPGRVVNALTLDGTGRLWIATDQGVFSLISGEKKRWNGYAATENANFLFCDREGAVWAGAPQGLVRFNPGGGLEQRERGREVYLSATEDREGDLWLGTESGGLAVLRDRKFSTLTAEDGLTDEYVLALAQAPDGHVGVGTKGGGLNIFRDGKSRALTTAQGLSSNVVLAVAAAANGDMWVGTPDGLNLIRDGEVVRAFTTADGLADDFVRAGWPGQRFDWRDGPRSRRIAPPRRAGSGCAGDPGYVVDWDAGRPEWFSQRKVCELYDEGWAVEQRDHGAL
jgi:ligand-binding sensor domain-containing protein